MMALLSGISLILSVIENTVFIRRWKTIMYVRCMKIKKLPMPFYAMTSVSAGYLYLKIYGV